MKGGSRARAGRPAEATSTAPERHVGEWTILPATGRPGRCPLWPLPVKANPDENRMWRRLWKRPEAVAWERFDLGDMVALYVRRYLEASQPGAKSPINTVVRQLAELLGLTPAGLRVNRWKIGGSTSAAPAAPETPAVPDDQAPRKVVAMGPARERFRPGAG